MKNIVKVRRFTDSLTRLYELPNDTFLNAGVIVSVEFPATVKGTTVGVTVSDSHIVDDDTEEIVLDLLHFTAEAWDSMKKVVSIYAETPVVWGADSDDELAGATDKQLDGDIAE